MTRLTIKDKVIRDNFNAEYAKLADLEDIEEELGIELEVLFSALKNGVYYFTPDGQLTHDYVWLVNNNVTAGNPDKTLFSFESFFDGQILLFEDYRKTWFIDNNGLIKEVLKLL